MLEPVYKLEDHIKILCLFFFWRSCRIFCTSLMAVVKSDSLTCNGRCGNANGFLICKLDVFWLEMMDVSAHIDADLMPMS